MDEFKIMLKMPAYYDINSPEDVIDFIKKHDILYEYDTNSPEAFNIFDVFINSNYYIHSNKLMKPAYCTLYSPTKILNYILYNGVKPSDAGFHKFLYNHSRCEEKNTKNEQEKIRFLKFYCKM